MKTTVIPATLDTMRPLVSEVSMLKVAGKTLAEWHVFHASGGHPEAVLEIAAELWPSAALWERLRGERGCRVVCDGRVLAVLTVPGTSVEDIVPDADSLVLAWPWELLTLNERLLANMKASDLRGTVHPSVVIDGFVELGEGSVMLPGVYVEGNAVFGKNCKIGPNCYIRGATSTGDGCHIGQAVEIKNSVLQDKVSAGHLSYVGDTVIGRAANLGAGTITSNLRHDGKNHRWRTAGGWVDTTRRKFGAIIGENVHTGIHTAIYPGRRIEAEDSTRPGEVVEK